MSNGASARVGLVGGPRAGVYDVYGGDADVDTILSVFPEYRLVRFWDKPEDYRDPMSEYEWAAKLEYVAEHAVQV